MEFQIGDYVKKVTGEYNINGVVVSVFQKIDGATRLVVEHKAEGGGSFLHIYGPNNLQLISKYNEPMGS
jgi:hypothetical protein